MANVWLVEDDVSLGDLTAAYLTKCGHTIRLFRDGQTVVHEVLQDPPDALILDIELPGESGLSICRRLRPGFAGAILMLTARSEEFDEILGLELGADDYVCKPASPRKLQLRLESALRRPASASAPVDTHRDADLTVSLPHRAVQVCGEDVALTTTEFDLLWLLVRHIGRPVSRETFFDEVRKTTYDGVDRSMDIYVSQLRRKLEAAGLPTTRLITVHGSGYQLTLAKTDPSPAAPGPP